MHLGACGGQRATYGSWLFPFTTVGPGVQNKVITLGGKHLYSLSHFASSQLPAHNSERLEMFCFQWGTFSGLPAEGRSLASSSIAVQRDLSKSFLLLLWGCGKGRCFYKLCWLVQSRRRWHWDRKEQKTTTLGLLVVLVVCVWVCVHTHVCVCMCARACMRACLPACLHCGILFCWACLPW